MNDTERKEIINKVIDRIVVVGKKVGRKFSREEKMNLKMGLFYARDDEFNNGKTDVLVGGNLNVKTLLECDEFSLLHDVFNICELIVKDSALPTFGTMTRCFIPRCGYANAVA